MISTSSRFLWYLGCSNSDFDLWIVFGTRIRWSSQWHWFQPVLAARSKFGFLGPPKIHFGSNLVKHGQNCWKSLRNSSLMKNYEKHCFAKVWTFFESQSNLGLTKGILVISAEKCTPGAPVPKQVTPRRSRCSHRPLERKWYFWIFWGLARKLRADNIRY